MASTENILNDSIKKILFLSDGTHTVAVKYDRTVQFTVFVKQNAWMLPKL